MLDDLRQLPDERPVLVEGFRLLPRLVGPHLSDPRHASWMLPTPRFRRLAFARRTGVDAFWLRTSEGEFFETLNTACHDRLPVLYVIEDNA